ncbi:MAG TPA: response regulator [Verrucomicrobiae bacterium]|nr:response regulator [Verrucomicrobiae bacterium]
MNKPRLLIIEDDDLQYEIYEEALANYELVRATSAQQALSLAAKQPPHLILLDHILDRGELGLEYLGEFKELLPHVPIIVVSGALEVHEQMKALQGPRRAHYCLMKPVDIGDLERTVETALRECGEAEVVRQFESLERSRRVDIESLLSRSTDRLSRQTQIRQMVAKSTSRPNISALARQFKVARRTIIRDLQELIRRGEVPADIYPKWEMEAPDGDAETAH